MDNAIQHAITTRHFLETVMTTTPRTTKTLKLGAVLIGVGDSSASELWRDEAVPLDASVNLQWYVQQAKEAEAARFDFLFIVDSQYITSAYPHHHLNRFEPLTLLSALATVTQRIGLIATVSTTYGEPFETARRLASLDLISDGRAGWNIVTSQDAGTASNFSRVEHGDYKTRYRRAAEVVDVVTGLWNSYEDGAFTTSRQASAFLDKSKLHTLNHQGEFFSVKGPLNIARSRQGQPPLVQAGTSPQGRDLSARVADIVFSFARTPAESLELAADVRRRAREYQRNVDEILFMPALNVVIADTLEEAAKIEAQRSAALSLEKMHEALSRQFNGRDFRHCPLDEPFPVIEGADAASSGLSQFRDEIEEGRKHGQTLRQVLYSLQTPWLRVVGTPETITDEIERWHASGAADGFNLFVHHPQDWVRFREHVVPLLRQRGLVDDDYQGATLREHLGLSVPEHRQAGRAELEHNADEAAREALPG